MPKVKEMKEMIDSVLANNKHMENMREIIKVMEKVDRKLFVKTDNPYIDIPVSIGYGQTISQPTTVARMLSLLDLKKGDNVLEIGSGSGWNAVLIACIVNPGKVYSIERIQGLSKLAKSNYGSVKEQLKIDNIEFFFGDALERKEKIWRKKYDKITATAAADLNFVEDLIYMGEQLLEDEGLLLFPTEEGNLELYKKKDKKLKKVYSEHGFAFVPLVKGIE